MSTSISVVLYAPLILSELQRGSDAIRFLPRLLLSCDLGDAPVNYLQLSQLLVWVVEHGAVLALGHLALQLQLAAELL